MNTTFLQQYKFGLDLLATGQDLDHADVRLRWLSLESQAASVLPGHASHVVEGDRDMVAELDTTLGIPPERVEETLLRPDALIEENLRFRCPLLLPADSAPRGLIILLNGLNERSSDRYLPWALRLLMLTGRAVLLFPLAFHLNRAPSAWADPRRMTRLSAERRSLHEGITASSLSNAALSARIQALPQRFLWSGVQSHEDVRDFIRALRSGAWPELASDLRVDFFGYSIGAFLALLLLMADRDALLAQSRLLAFCGGAALDGMALTSRYILDSAAHGALLRCFRTDFSATLRNDARLAGALSGGHPAGAAFRSMLSANDGTAARGAMLAPIASRVRAIALTRDEVMPPDAVRATLCPGAAVGVDVRELDFPYDYSHVHPFPLLPALEMEVERAFDSVMTLTAEHLA